MQFLRLSALAAVMSGAFSYNAQAWDYEGHRIVNQLALAALPADFPGFVKTPVAAERIAFLAGEPDRWRSTPDLPLKHGASPDHYMDFEQIAMAGMDAKTIPDLRYLFATEFAAGRASHLSAFPAPDPAKNADHTAEWMGFLPWEITEYYGRLKASFSYLKAFESLGTPEEIANAKENVIYTMGLMGHYVGDSAQPLHISIHHNGWVGENPNNYTRWSGFHSWIDGGFIAKANIKAGDIVPRVKPADGWKLEPVEGGRDPMFVLVMNYISAQHEFVEPIYALEKSGAFKSETAATSVEGRKFIEDRLLTGGETLAAIWVTAYKESGPDTYLSGKLLKRKEAAEAGKKE